MMIEYILYVKIGVCLVGFVWLTIISVSMADRALHSDINEMERKLRECKDNLARILSSLPYKAEKHVVESLAARVSHLENKEEADKLLEEYTKLYGTRVFVYKDSQMMDEGGNYYSLTDFVHGVLCPLRNAKLKRMESDEQSRLQTPSESGIVTYDPSDVITYTVSSISKPHTRQGAKNKRKRK